MAAKKQGKLGIGIERSKEAMEEIFTSLGGFVEGKLFTISVDNNAFASPTTGALKGNRDTWERVKRDKPTNKPTQRL
jgi:hypothetical protein